MDNFQGIVNIDIEHLNQNVKGFEIYLAELKIVRVFSVFSIYLIDAPVMTFILCLTVLFLNGHNRTDGTFQIFLFSFFPIALILILQK
jgi:hypothetical protein